ncbi:MAG: hypothetical protein ACR2FO_06365 [Actinomycetota bacterium]
MAVIGSPAFAKFNLNEPNSGGVVVGEGDAPDCVGGSCGGVIVEDVNGVGPNCDWGNCGGSVCAGSNCGSCEGGNCGGSISGDAMPADKVHVSKETQAGSLPRTGISLPMASTIALGLGLMMVGAFFTFVGSPSSKLAVATKGYTPKRRA